MKKGMSITLTVILVFSLAFSFSAPVFADSWHYVGCDAVGDISSLYAPVDDSTFTLKYVPGVSSSYSKWFNSLAPSSAPVVRLDTLSYHFVNPIPSNCQVTFEIYCRLRSVDSSYSVIHNYSGGFTIRNPRGDFIEPTLYQVFSTYNSPYDQSVRIIGSFSYVGNASLSSITLQDVGFGFSILPTSTAKNYQFLFGGLRFSYTSLEDESYGNVLDQIKDNTGATKDAVNQQGEAIQQEIADQTQQQTDHLENGFNNGGMESSNKDLNDSLTGYDQKESEISDQATGYIDSATFVNPAGTVQVMAAISFTTSWLQSLFVNLGDWGILVMVSLSLTFALMLVGWFRFRK